MLALKSSNVDAAGYDPTSKTMRIRFKGTGTYELQGVEHKHWRDFMSAESHGKHFHAHLKGKFVSRKLEAE